MSERRAPARTPPDASENPNQRELIRSHMKMVIDQLEGILKELKDVAHELREVVGQIDKLTSDFDFDLEPDDWTVATASSTSSSERGLGEAFRLDFLSHDLLSDSWEFCNYLEASASASASASTSTSTAPGAGPGSGPGSGSGSGSRLGAGEGGGRGGAVTRTKSVGVRASTTAVQTGDENSDSGSGPGRTGGLVSPSSVSPPPSTTTTGTSTGPTSAYSQMNGGIPIIPNGPLIVTPDSSSEEASSSTHSQKTSRTSGTRERVRFSDKILYHALCCDDDEDEEEEEEEEAYGVGEDGDEDEEEDEEDDEDDKRDCCTPDTDSELSPLACSPVPPLSSLISSAATEHSRLHNCLTDPASAASTAPSLVGRLPLGTHSLGRKGLLQPSCRKKLLRNSSTQTVSDKSTQTVLPYVPAKQKTKDH
ncbi:inhibitory synaptic factor 1 [Alosa sapidissima]|uniref:inhibitory synaptic factor 1 n=1 Tax=Alosa sapidissima TaxID=34773 RepID=UPI001C0A39D9|nr:inhibitory synaptic factor 1 [Alosa sapidissima]